MCISATETIKARRCPSCKDWWANLSPEKRAEINVARRAKHLEKKRTAAGIDAAITVSGVQAGASVRALPDTRASDGRAYPAVLVQTVAGVGIVFLANGERQPARKNKPDDAWRREADRASQGLANFFAILWDILLGKGRA